MYIPCVNCGKGIPDGKPCPFCTKSTVSEEMKFDPMNEVLILHGKLDTITLELIEFRKSIQCLAEASMSHSQAFLNMVAAMEYLKKEVDKNKPEEFPKN